MKEEMTLVIEALTRSSFRRGDLTFLHGYSDEDLVRHVTHSKTDPDTTRTLAAVSHLLRLMDGLLAGKETGEGFVYKFSERWLLLAGGGAPPLLDEILDELEEFYSEIQMFCALPRHHEEEPGLSDLESLKQLTANTYNRVKGDLTHVIGTLGHSADAGGRPL